MTDSRPVTLYEYASLRMHPNRERAKRRHANPVHPKPTHHKTRIAIVDKLGNVLAPNAAGRRYPGATLSKRKRLRPALSASEVDTDSRSVSRKRRRLDADGELGSDFVPSDEDVDADSDEDEWMPKTQQARNRAAFYHDQSFLNEPDSTTSNGRALNDLRKSFHPSADLLKYIHWHASEMWTEDGMLFDDNAEKSKYWMARNGAAGGRASGGGEAGTSGPTTSRPLISLRPRRYWMAKTRPPRLARIRTQARASLTTTTYQTLNRSARANARPRPKLAGRNAFV